MQPHEAIRAARILAEALDDETDIRDLAARVWEMPTEATARDLQILAAYALAQDIEA